MLRKIWEFVWGKNLVVYRLRKALRKLYEGYPTHKYSGYLQRSIQFQQGIKVLEDDKIIKKMGRDPDGNPTHRLLPEGLRLVELWNTERLTLILLDLILFQILLAIDLKFLF